MCVSFSIDSIDVSALAIAGCRTSASTRGAGAVGTERATIVRIIERPLTSYAMRHIRITSTISTIINVTIPILITRSWKQDTKTSFPCRAIILPSPCASRPAASSIILGKAQDVGDVSHGGEPGRSSVFTVGAGSAIGIRIGIASGAAAVRPAPDVLERVYIIGIAAVSLAVLHGPRKGGIEGVVADGTRALSGAGIGKIPLVTLF